MLKFGAIFSIFGVLFLSVSPAWAEKSAHDPSDIRAIYLSSDHLYSNKKIAELELVFKTTKANGIVIDYKDSNTITPEYQFYIKNLVDRFKKGGVYTIARIVTFQDTKLAKAHPEVAIRTGSGDFWRSGRKVWDRRWVDMSSLFVQEYNIEIAKKAIDAGFNEIQFDYIRFPTDGPKDIRYPAFDSQKESKTEVMDNFFRKLRKELKSYSPSIVLSVDLYGEVFVYGQESSIGQNLVSAADSFDVLSPMAYPTHYKCGEFGVNDPSGEPYLVYFDTIRKGLGHLNGKKIIVRPWIQDFSISSIYNCGKKVNYDVKKVKDEIKAGNDLGVRGFMLWSPRNKYTTEVFN